MTTAVLVVLFAQTETGGLFREIEAFLSERPELAELHQGYLEFLESGSLPAHAEQSFNELLASPRFREIIVAFDEELVANPELEDAFYRHYRHLAENPRARQAVESIRRIVRREKAHRDVVEPAVRYMKANPERAREFLEAPESVTPEAEELRAIRGLLGRDRTLRGQLFDAFDTIARDPSAMREVTPYWQRSADIGAAAAMDNFLTDRPGMRQAFDRRNLLLAQKPELRMWADHWRRLVRRNTNLAPLYAEYIQQLADDPDQRQALLTQWSSERGSADWPPERKPPRLTPLRGAAWTKVNRPEVPRPAKPKAPVVAPIKGPERPTAPTRPERPELRKHER